VGYAELQKNQVAAQAAHGLMWRKNKKPPLPEAAEKLAITAAGLPRAPQRQTATPRHCSEAKQFG
jgi:hypothetical protein